MSLLTRIEADRQTLRRRRDPVGEGILGVVIGACEVRQSNITPPTRTLTDEEVAEVVQEVLLRIEQSLAQNSQKTEQERLQRERQQLLSYMPQRLTDEELMDIAVRQHRIMNVTQIMLYLKVKYAGRYDPQHAIEIVRGVAS